MGVLRRSTTTGAQPRLRVVSSAADSPFTRQVAAPYSTHRSITAAARQLNVQNKTEVQQLARRRTASLPWQQEAWEYYDAIGEVKFAFTMVANILSRVRLYAGKITDTSTAPTAVDPDDTAGQAAISALRRLDSVYGGQPGLMRDAALNFLVAGECYLVQLPGTPGFSPESWDIRSIDEVVVQTDGTIKLRTQSGLASQTDLTLLPPRAYVARLWRSHPRFSDDADSSMLSLRDLCAELLLLNRTYRATARSRLNAGALYLPDGLSVAANPTVDEQDPAADAVDPALFASDQADDEDDFEEALIEAMTTPISDESSVASVVPLIIRGPAELGDKIKQFKFERSFDEALTARADRVLDRIMQGIDVPKDAVQGLSQVKYCVTRDTEALTKDGWKTQDQIAVGDVALTLNHETGMSEWQPIQAINTFNVVDEPMLRMENKTHSSLTTLGHRWPTIRKHRSYGERRMWTTSGELAASDRFVTAAPAVDLPQEAKYSDDLVELLAWFYTEGCYSPRVNRDWSGLSQSISANPQKVERIRASLTRLLGPSVAVKSRSLAAVRGATHQPEWRESSAADGTVAHFHFNHELTRQIAPFFSDFKSKILDKSFVHELTRAQLQLFVDVSIMADGYGTCDYGMLWQDVPARLDAAETACALLGVTTRRIQDAKFLRITTKRPLVRPRPESRSIETFTGVVWCPTTSNKSWFARRDGKSYFTGNSNAQVIDESLYKAHLEPLALLICDSLTTAFLRPAMVSLGIEELVAADYCVWYDPSEVTTRPNKSEDADAGHDRKLLSGAAWRRAHGFTDEDAPTPTEIALDMLIEKGAVTPELTESLLSVLAPDIMAKVREASQAANPAPLPDAVATALGAPPTASTDSAGAPAPLTEPDPAVTTSPAELLPASPDPSSLV